MNYQFYEIGTKTPDLYAIIAYVSELKMMKKSDLLPEGFLNEDSDKYNPRRFQGIRCHPHIQTSLCYLIQLYIALK